MVTDERDKARAEAVWDERISPTLKGRYTINRGGIVSCIADVGGAAREDTYRDVAAMLGCEPLPDGATERDLRAQIVDRVAAREKRAMAYAADGQLMSTASRTETEPST